jgi:hypothetical protein
MAVFTSACESRSSGLAWEVAVERMRRYEVSRGRVCASRVRMSLMEH